MISLIKEIQYTEKKLDKCKLSIKRTKLKPHHSEKELSNLNEEYIVLVNILNILKINNKENK